MDKKLLILSSLLIIAFIGFASFVLLQEPIGRFTRAADANTQPSTQTSLIFAWPLAVKADNTERSDISVFIRDVSGKGLPEQEVQLISSLGEITPSTAMTDADGKAMFRLTSATVGVAKIEAVVDNNKLERTVTVQFE